MSDELRVLGIDAGAAQTTLGRGVECPCHVVDAPMVGPVLDLLGGRFSCGWSRLLPSFVPNLLPTITIVLLVLVLGACSGLVSALAISLLPL